MVTTPNATRNPLARMAIPDDSDVGTIAVELALPVAWLLPDTVGVERTASWVAEAKLALAVALTLLT